jgi:hypothetical protein
MIFVGPQLLSGIGQVTLKYSKLFPKSKYYCLGTDPVPLNEDVFMYALPTPQWLSAIPLIKNVSKSVTCMTICETETVHEDYGKLFDLFETVLVQSEFCKNIFERQFPKTNFKIVHQYVPPICTRVFQNMQFTEIPKNKYVFYHIGNITDPRKNINALIRGFMACDFGDRAHLVLKATCLQPVSLSHPHITVINGLIEDDDQLQQIHHQCNCYVSFSFSEGIGMGAVEAALHDKPVIITEYGGAKEYIKTPYTVQCGTKKLEHDDFLFKKGMEWGDPHFPDLVKFMKHAFNERLSYMDHTHTKEIVSKRHVLDQFSVHVIGEKDNETNKKAAGHQ